MFDELVLVDVNYGNSRADLQLHDCYNAAGKIEE